MKNDINFLEYLVNETAHKRLSWNKLPYNNYLQIIHNYDLFITHKEDPDALSGAGKISAAYSNISTTLSVFNADKIIYQTTLKNVDIYLIENISYKTSFPSYSYELNLIYFNTKDRYNCFNYFVDLSDNLAYNKIYQLAEIICAHPVDEVENAQNFMSLVLDESNSDQ